jgi:hypothetical protein
VCKIEFPHQKALIADTKAFDQGRSALRHFLGSVATTTDQSPTSNVTNIGLEGSPPLNLNSSYKQDHKGRPENKMTTHVKLVNLLESTLWNRKLAPTLEDIVNALVAQIFEGIRDHCVASAEMKVSYVSHWQFYSHYNY